MDGPTAQTAEQPLPELIRFMLEHMQGLQLEGPPTSQPEDCVNAWQSLAAAGKLPHQRNRGLAFQKTRPGGGD